MKKNKYKDEGVMFLSVCDNENSYDSAWRFMNGVELHNKDIVDIITPDGTVLKDVVVRIWKDKAYIGHNDYYTISVHQFRCNLFGMPVEMNLDKKLVQIRINYQAMKDRDEREEQEALAEEIKRKLDRIQREKEEIEKLKSLNFSKKKAKKV